MVFVVTFIVNSDQADFSKIFTNFILFLLFTEEAESGAATLSAVCLTMVRLNLHLVLAYDLTLVNLELQIKLQMLVANDLTLVDKCLFCTHFFVFLVIFIVSSDQIF